MKDVKLEVGYVLYTEKIEKAIPKLELDKLRRINDILDENE